MFFFNGGIICVQPELPCFRIVGGQNTCAEQVPWNVLVENRQTLKGRIIDIFYYLEVAPDYQVL